MRSAAPLACRALLQIALLLLPVGRGAAQLPALDFTGTVRPFQLDRMTGLEFSVARPVTVVELGRFDINGNGILDDPGGAEVGIWDANNGQLLRSTVIGASTPATDGSFFGSIDSLTLPQGRYVVGTLSSSVGEPIGLLSGSFEMLAEMEPIQTRLNTVDTFQFPTSSRARQWMSATFQIDAPLVITDPSPWSVAQRDASGQAVVKVEGLLGSPAELVEIRATDSTGSNTDWQSVSIADEKFAGQIALPSGWNTIEVRSWDGGAVIGSDLVNQVGVGEVFVTAGQSNSANHGSPRQQPQSGMVGAMNEIGNWRAANDPQPIATGDGGSPWPLLGDLLAEAWEVPIGFVSVGWGGTRVDEWLPGGTLYPRLQNALERLGPHGARAILWHQGESDALNSTSSGDYAERLQQVIAQSRVDAQFDIPWGVALAAFLPQNSLAQEAQVVAGQRLVIDGDPLVFEGPTTEDLLGDQWRYDAIHFNQAGLEEHASRWATALHNWLVPEPTVSPVVFLLCGLALRHGRTRKHSTAHNH